VTLLRAFREAMNTLGVTGKLIATDIVEESAAMRLADVRHTVPKVNSLDYIPSMLQAVEEHKVGLLIPVTDLDLRTLARHREEFRRRGCEIMIGPEETINICRNKKHFSNFLLDHDLPAIRTLNLAQFRQNPFYPCFVKPFRGSGAKGAAMIKDGKALRGHIAHFGKQLLIQDYVPGQEYTMDVYRTRTGEVKVVVPRQRLVVRSGEVEQAVTVNAPILIDLAKQVANILDGLWGVFCCQCRRDENGTPFFFELNPRFGGGVLLSIAAGANLPLYLLQEVLGLPFPPNIGEFTPGKMLLRYYQDVFCDIEDPSTLAGYKSPIFHY
jgi:carbamoyl-phosphate synthase large subunit